MSIKSSLPLVFALVATSVQGQEQAHKIRVGDTIEDKDKICKVTKIIPSDINPGKSIIQCSDGHYVLSGGPKKHLKKKKQTPPTDPK